MPCDMPADCSPAGGNHRCGTACAAGPHHRRPCRGAGWGWLPKLWSAPLPRLPGRPSSAPCRLPWRELPSPLSRPATGIRILRNELAAVANFRRRADDKPRGSHARDAAQIGGADGRRGIGDAAHGPGTRSRGRGVVSGPPVGDAEPAASSVTGAGGADSASAATREATAIASSRSAAANAAAGPCAIAAALRAAAAPRATDRASAACNSTAPRAEARRAEPRRDEAAVADKAGAGSREGLVR